MPDDPYLPRFARALGYGGLLPLAILIALALLQPAWAATAARIGIVYGGAILSFLGGIQWGFALRSSLPALRVRRLAAGVLPSLWVTGTLLMPVDLCVPLLVAGLVALLIYEFLEQREPDDLPWYLPLRLQLTAGLSVELGLLYAVAVAGA